MTTDRRYTFQPCERCGDAWCSGCENADLMPVRCEECGGTGWVDEYISRAQYEAEGAPDPVKCAECGGTGWVEDA